ncbi:hypothetical protein MHU86_5411 [Fragilaria crotonensis]|nr:hypothetical protein MHU86_5411 [Fragilaria crotonensis]
MTATAFDDSIVSEGRQQEPGLQKLEVETMTSQPPYPDFRTFMLDFTSKILFMVASACYVVVAAVGLNHPLRGTKFMLVSLFAAFLFSVVGVIDMLLIPRIMGAIMILAGVFGILSVAIQDILASKVMNCISVHLFLMEAIGQFILKRSEIGRLLRFYLRTGDVFWIFGSLTDVILSYVSLGGQYADSEAGAALFSSCLWLVSSLVFVSAAIYVRVTMNGTNTTTSNTVASYPTYPNELEMKVDGGENQDAASESKIV